MPRNEITATYRIVTPLFLGDARSEWLADTICPTSVKGALRFWWRAVNWRRFRAVTSCDSSALRLLHHEEARLFGSAAGDGQGGQSRFLLRTAFDKPKAEENKWPANDNTGSGYLGLGLWETKGKETGKPQPHRKAFPENHDFRVILRFRPGTQQADIENIRETLRIWGLLGGLGGRGQRRGFGSVAITHLDGRNERTMDEKGYGDRLCSLLGTDTFDTDILTDNPPYTAFGPGFRVIIAASCSDPRKTHNALGQIFKEYRGQNGNLRGQEKIPFGLPLQMVDDKNRRASPLLFHIHPLKGNRFMGVVAFFPTTTFHHDREYADITLFRVEEFLNGKEQIVPPPLP
ncbi:MAG: type III-B CRISPR module RAMP protein Cmr1 [Gammaproteobacteria bacterium]|nr:type III-B CRISPR module RAMP protein Cmr1 [Gammaproteobacteria bacterium]